MRTGGVTTLTSIGALIKIARENRRWSQNRLADVLNDVSGHATLDGQYISRWERGIRTPDVFWLGHLATVLHLDLAQLEYAAHEPQASSSLPVVTGPEMAVVPRLTSDGRVVFTPSPVAEPTGDPNATVDIKPATYFAAALHTLITNDNLFGPRDVITRAERQMTIIGHAWASARGADRMHLIQLRAQFAEFCSWLYQDLGNHQAAQQWADRALDWSYISGDQQLTVYVLARKSQLACDMRDHDTATGIGRAAVAAAPHVKLAAIASTFTAHGHALGGDRDSADRTYDMARAFVAQSDDECSWGAWLDDSYIEVHRAQSLTELGEHCRAAAVFDRALAALPGAYYRDRGVYLARAARAHAGAGELDYAATLGITSLTIATETQSGRIATELSRLSNELKEVKTASVKQFHDVMSTVVMTNRR